MADSVSGIGNMQDWPQTFIIPESKEVLNKIKETNKQKMMGLCQRDTKDS